MTATEVRVSTRWLRLREPADASARARGLVEPLARRPPGGTTRVVHDLGCGDGAMSRWLAPQLGGPQHWVLHDRDPDLLAVAAADPPLTSADGAAVTLETRCGDITRLGPRDLAGATLVTASALLDMFTADEVERFVAVCVMAGCPALVTLSVTGGARLDPPDPLDPVLAAAFDDHQRRTTGGRTLLGPDAVHAAVRAFGRHGWQVETRRSPWRLGSRHPALLTEWLDGWAGAAREQSPELAPAAADHLARRGGEILAGRLTATVPHLDLLARPPGDER